MPRRVKFYCDDHIGKAVARALRRRGADVVTAHEAGMAGAKDDDHLRSAHSQGRVVITQDKDFLVLHASGVSHSGIAYAHQETPWPRIRDSLILIFEVLDPDDMIGKIEYL